MILKLIYIFILNERIDMKSKSASMIFNHQSWFWSLFAQARPRTMLIPDQNCKQSWDHNHHDQHHHRQHLIQHRHSHQNHQHHHRHQHHHHRHGQHHHPHQHHPQGKGQRELVTGIANRGQYNSSFNSVCEIKRSSVNLIYIWFTLLFSISLSCEIRFVRILNMLRGQKLPPQLLFSVFSPAQSLAICEFKIKI